VIGMLDPNDAICGRGQIRLRAAGVEVALFDHDLMAQIEEINREFIRDQASTQPSERTRTPTSDPASPGEAGLNGRAGYTDAGDKAEDWIPGEKRPGESWWPDAPSPQLQADHRRGASMTPPGTSPGRRRRHRTLCDNFSTVSRAARSAHRRRRRPDSAGRAALRADPAREPGRARVRVAP
jgi:hypothetical protein